jgi:hypothetical protein
MSIGKHKTLETRIYGKYTLIDCVEISIDPSNGQNDLEPKTLGLGLGVVVAMLIRIRNKYDMMNPVLN